MKEITNQQVILKSDWFTISKRKSQVINYLTKSCLFLNFGYDTFSGYLRHFTQSICMDIPFHGSKEDKKNA